MRIRADDVVVRYPGLDRAAVDGVSVDVSSGSLHVVLGPNGSGKSTLFRALLGVAPISGGSVWLDDREAGAWTRRDRARAIGVVPQSESVAFPLSTREMVAMGRYPHLGALSAERPADTAAVEDALDACDVAHLRDRDVATLSGGEFQRVRIARALAQQPRALVLDEPTASLDVRHEMGILELLRGSADRGLTVLLITHGIDVVTQFADRILLLSNGRAAAEGVPVDVIREETLTHVYDWPISVHLDPETGAPRVTPKRSSRAGQPTRL